MDRFDWIEIDDEAAVARQEQEPPFEKPCDGPTFYRAARRMRESGHFKPAVAHYERALGFQPHHYASWVELIDTLVRARQLEVAEERSQHALDSYRQVRALYASRALVLAHQGQYREAKRHLEVGVDSERPWYGKCIEAEILLRQDISQRSIALVCLEDAAAWADPAWEAHFIAGWMLLDADLPTMAAGHFAEAGHAKPTAPIGWLCLGDCFRALRLYDQALFYYQRVTELEPTHDLALRRQKECSPKLFGLMKFFRRDALRKRWKEEIE